MKIILKKSMPILFSVLSLLIATVNADCPSGIVSYWKLDETTGSVAEDSVGIYNGTLDEGTWTNGKVNNGIYFNGVYDSGYIIAGNELSMDNSFTLEAWVKPDEDITNQDREIILRGHLTI